MLSRGKKGVPLVLLFAASVHTSAAAAASHVLCPVASKVNCMPLWVINKYSISEAQGGRDVERHNEDKDSL